VVLRSESIALLCVSDVIDDDSKVGWGKNFGTHENDHAERKKKFDEMCELQAGNAII